MKHLAPFYMKKVSFDHLLLRTSDYPMKKWVRIGCAKREGIVVGIRRLQNGRIVSLGYGDGNVFEATSYTLALLVVFSPWRNPVYVLQMDAKEIVDA